MSFVPQFPLLNESVLFPSNRSILKWKLKIDSESVKLSILGKVNVETRRSCDSIMQKKGKLFLFNEHETICIT